MSTFNYTLNTTGIYPAQKLPATSKNEEWKKATMDYYIGKFYFGNNNNSVRRHDMKVAYDLYNSVFDELDFKYITDPFKVEDGFPASVQNLNIIKPKIDLLLGEETKRPFPFKVIQINDEATSSLQERRKADLNTVLFDIAQQGGPDEPITDKDIEKVTQVEKYYDTKYTTMAEKLGYSTIEYLMEKEEIKTKFLKGFHNWLCSSLAVFYVGQVGGEPTLEVVNLLDFSFDDSPEVQYVEDGEYAVRRMRMTPVAIYDRFQDIMPETELDKLLEKNNFTGSANGGMNEFKSINWKNIPFYPSSDENQITTNTLVVWHVTWKSYKKYGFLSYIDETGEEVTEVVDEFYKASEGETLTWEWGLEVWEGYRIGDDMYVGVKPVAEQAHSVDYPYRAKLPYVGAVFNNNNTVPKSLVDIMKPLQYMYIVIWYRLELALARDKGKIINMDVTQIPKSMGVDVNKWLHYLSASGVNFINPYEEGWDIPGREGGKPAGFNQISQVDLTMGNVIVGYINLMNKIEDMVGEISGITKQREGQTAPSELVTNAQQNIVQSGLITEPIVFGYNQVKRRVLNSLLNVAKNVWHTSNKKKLHYITDDALRVFMDINDDFLYSDLGIFMSDSTKESQNLEMLKSLYQPAMQNGASLFDIASIMTSNNVEDIKGKLEKIEKDRQQRENEIAQQQQEAAAQIEQMRNEVMSRQMDIEGEKLRIAEEDSIRKAETSIQTALINAQAKLQGDMIKAESMPDETVEESNEPTSLDMEKFKQQVYKESLDLMLKNKQIDETIRHNIATEQISRSKPKTSSTTKSKK